VGLHHPFFLVFEKVLAWQLLKIWCSILFPHPSIFWTKKHFQSFSYTFSSKSGNFIHIFNRNEKFLAKKDWSYPVKSRHLFWNGAIWHNGAKKKGRTALIPHSLPPEGGKEGIFLSNWIRLVACALNLLVSDQACLMNRFHLYCTQMSINLSTVYGIWLTCWQRVPVLFLLHSPWNHYVFRRVTFLKSLSCS